MHSPLAQSGPVRKQALFYPVSYRGKRSIYRDRLGTNTSKPQSKGRAFFPTSGTLQRVKALIEAPGANLGFPSSSAPGGVQPAITIYAWNEFQEGMSMFRFLFQ
jgi:hypothetical protein